MLTVQLFTHPRPYTSTSAPLPPPSITAAGWIAPSILSIIPYSLSDIFIYYLSVDCPDTAAMRPSLAVLAAALQATVGIASTLTPPVLPLIVRNPYLSTWFGNARDEPWTKWPMFYTGEEVGLSLMAHVPSTGTVYPLLGKPHESLPGYALAQHHPHPIHGHSN